MNPAEYQWQASDHLVVGCCGVPLELVAVLNVCRRYDGIILFREKDVMVIEFNHDPALIDAVLAALPRSTLTHVWRRARQAEVIMAPRPPPAAPVLRTNFCSP